MSHSHGTVRNSVGGMPPRQQVAFVGSVAPGLRKPVAPWVGKVLDRAHSGSKVATVAIPKNKGKMFDLYFRSNDESPEESRVGAGTLMWVNHCHPQYKKFRSIVEDVDAMIDAGSIEQDEMRLIPVKRGGAYGIMQIPGSFSEEQREGIDRVAKNVTFFESLCGGDTHNLLRSHELKDSIELHEDDEDVVNRKGRQYVNLAKMGIRPGRYGDREDNEW